MIDVHVQSTRLDDGIPLMYWDLGQRVRMAYDPRQIEEADAVAALCLCLPHLMNNFSLRSHSDQE